MIHGKVADIPTPRRGTILDAEDCGVVRARRLGFKRWLGDLWLFTRNTSDKALATLLVCSQAPHPRTPKSCAVIFAAPEDTRGVKLGECRNDGIVIVRIRG